MVTAFKAFFTTISNVFLIGAAFSAWILTFDLKKTIKFIKELD